MSRPSTSGYAPIPSSSTAPVSSGDPVGEGPSDDDDDLPTPTLAHPPPAPKAKKRETTAHQVDILFKRWKSEIALKIRRKKRAAEKGAGGEGGRREIVESVFPVWEPEGKGKGREEREWRTLDHLEPMSLEIFQSLVERVREAIDEGVQPRLNSKGSSGSYFARDTTGATIGIFKPKDEEPYGSLNPKFIKWVHRNFLARVIPFGRSCLIPQLSYLSEAAASLLDRRLGSYIVPRTEVVKLGSPSFFYDYAERAKKGGKWRLKEGSFQTFLKGYQDATEFLKEYPYPGRPLSQTLSPSPRRHRQTSIFATCLFLCGRSEAEEDDESIGWGWGGVDPERQGGKEDGFKWTPEMMESCREELEKLVILDYLMRNTDRGLDNFMMKPCLHPLPSCPTPFVPHLHLAAIDNSLSFPHVHPTGWRSFTYGWLYLPLSLIGQPFSPSTRAHYLPLLTSKAWWEETTRELRELFGKDEGFEEKMWRRQLAVIKGQGWNIVQSLLREEDGPLELCRRDKKLVWDDVVSLPPLPSILSPPIDPIPTSPSPAASPPFSSPSPSTPTTPTMPPIPFPSPSRPRNSHARTSSSFSSLLSDERYGSITGVSMMVHLDRLEADERALESLLHPRRRMSHTPVEEEVEGDGEEEEWGVRSESDLRRNSNISSTLARADGGPESPKSWRSKVRDTLSFDIERTTEGRNGSMRGRRGSVGDVGRPTARTRRAVGGSSYDVERGEEEEEEGEIRIGIVERLETVLDKPLLDGWW